MAVETEEKGKKNQKKNDGEEAEGTEDRNDEQKKFEDRR